MPAPDSAFAALLALQVKTRVEGPPKVCEVCGEPIGTPTEIEAHLNRLQPVRAPKEHHEQHAS